MQSNNVHLAFARVIQGSTHPLWVIAASAHPSWVYEAFLGGILIAVIFIPILIAWQRGRALGQMIYEDGPKSHVTKQGTPTMGGLVFLIAAAAALLLALFKHDPDEVALSLLAIGAGCIGAVDDLLIIIKKRPLGLKARWKFLLLAIVGAIFAWHYSYGQGNDPLRFVGMGPWWAEAQHFFGLHFSMPPALFFILATLAVVGAANAVNLADGLDGLAAGAALPVLFALIVADLLNAPMAAVAGACIGFLWFNRYPARIFMGDTGSLLLGALIAGAAIQSGWLLVLPLLGIVFVVEALSVIAQVVSFKLTGKRIFKMSPLHHHFELSGWPEKRVTRTFVAISWLAMLAVGAAMALT
ncbi:MAG TPA: phospho-N-acetylmuramoyl-pentapeptide-transferase [Candidatus Eremiobacteraceae bacterium]|nr:phospho-N-acetylmuramoyl-pentapeptide-transferase [Candidatus Eremiobacteraceae bacterium]